MTTPGDPEEQPPPGYVPAPGGYGYVPEDYRWESPPGTPPPAYQPPPAQQPPGAAGKPVLASWPDRVMSGLIDFFGLYFVALYVNLFHGRSAAYPLFLLAGAWGLYNGYAQGQTGQSVGKRVIGLRTVSERDGKPIGGGAGFGRAFLHVLDVLPCFAGMLMPLWDAKRQTFADKIMGTLVVKKL